MKGVGVEVALVVDVPRNRLCWKLTQKLVHGKGLLGESEAFIVSV